jgi:hypothetical protein
MTIPTVALLLAIQALQGMQGSPSDSAVTRAREAITPMTDSVALRDAGYFAIGFGAGQRDLTPFQGQHWLSVGRWLNNRPVDLLRPTFMMYLPIDGKLVPIGVAHSLRISADSGMPTTLAGVPVEWHSHVFCRAVPGEGQALADGVEDCKARGGNPAPNQLSMVHVWTVPNPDGPYAHDNPALPFIATGLTPPAHASRDDRLFAVALGETYGAKLVIAHRIQRDVAKTPEAAQRLENRRAPMRAIVPKLREAERAHDAVRFAALHKELIDDWNALADEYRALAGTPELKARVDIELQQALDPHTHHHM